ncbi:hypothetical protein SAMN04488598_1742 [Halanaerobium congolense]|uniref:Uncharacterized protein n=1 Tax=Halanaerobium congolense TaxID=54121 RepID=A0A1I0DAQ1_9FIRM|nr:hypothetical protein [Halanaerobium congolense]PTX14553.1 hypothetical protein C7953_2976 [Halanaerobium congolense]SDG26415.1 hypothetical protein SAMN04488598_1742 [Halanaerobium congolense]SET28760.1 hypothetical protein SAMN04515652_1674 [Halanaerobium congolense]SFP81681.1 hypothetical protein SAMN04488596_1732 [Halanaerobium congolense]
MIESDQNKYWEVEEPEVIDNGSLLLQHYEKHGALQLQMKGIDSESGESYVKKGLNLRKEVLFKQPKMLETLAFIFSEWLHEYDNEIEKE